MLSSCKNLPLSRIDVIRSAANGEDRVFTLDWGLDVGVGLGSESFDLAAYRIITTELSNEKMIPSEGWC